MFQQAELDSLNNWLAIRSSATELSTRFIKILEDLPKLRGNEDKLAGQRDIRVRLPELKDALSRLATTGAIEDNRDPEVLTTLLATLFCCRLLLAAIQAIIQKPTCERHVLLSIVQDALQWRRLDPITRTQVATLKAFAKSEATRSQSTASSMDTGVKSQQLQPDIKQLQNIALRVQRHTECLLDHSLLRCIVRRMTFKHAMPPLMSPEDYFIRLCDGRFKSSQPSPDMSLPKSLSDVQRSKRIDKSIKAWHDTTRVDCKGLVLGPHGCGQELILTDLEMSSPGRRRSQYTQQIRSYCLETAYKLVHELIEKDLGFVVEPIASLSAWHARCIEDSATASDHPFDGDMADAVTEIWSSPELLRLREISFCGIPEAEHGLSLLNDRKGDIPAYFLTNIHRIISPCYTPTNSDIAHLKRTLHLGITSTPFQVGNINVEVTELGGCRNERKKWIHYFENPDFILFVASLSQYDSVFEGEDPTQNVLKEALVLWESVVNSRWFAERTQMILCLTDVNVFCEKVGTGRSPLEKFFPEYKGGSDVMAALEFVLEKFSECKKGNRTVWPVLIQREETTCVDTIRAVIEQIMLEKVARR